MNSANRVTRKIARKIHSDQKPRRLRQKLSSRRRVSGVIFRPRKRSAVGGARWVGAGGASEAKSPAPFASSPSPSSPDLIRGSAGPSLCPPCGERERASGDAVFTIALL